MQAWRTVYICYWNIFDYCKVFCETVMKILVNITNYPESTTRWNLAQQNHPWRASVPAYLQKQAPQIFLFLINFQCTENLSKRDRISCSDKNVFWKYAASLQENTYVEVWFEESFFVTLLKSHFSMGFLLQICCIFSEHLFIWRADSVSFW